MRCWQVVVATFFVLGIKAAYGQPAGVEANAVFREAQVLMENGKVAAGCEAFEKSQELEAATATLGSLGRCRERNRQLATAWRVFLEVQRQTQGARDKEGRRWNRLATARVEALEPVLSKLTIVVAAGTRVEGLVVRREEDVVSEGQWSRALPVDGGVHEIRVTAPGYAEWSHRIAIGDEKDVKVVQVPRLLVSAGGTALSERPEEPEKTEEVEEAEEKAGERRERRGSRGNDRWQTVAPYFASGTAVVFAGVALGVGLSGASTYAKAVADQDAQKRAEHWHSANQKKAISMALGATSFAFAGVAVWLFHRAAKREEASLEREQMSLVPQVTRHSLGVVFTTEY
jgi:hypothetical protein